MAQYLSVDLAEFREAFSQEGPSPTAPSRLEQITVPVLLTVGAGTGWPGSTPARVWQLAASLTRLSNAWPASGISATWSIPNGVADAMLPFLKAA